MQQDITLYVRDGQLTEEGGRMVLKCVRRAVGWHRHRGSKVRQDRDEIESYAISRTIPQVCRYDPSKATRTFELWVFFHARRNIAEYFDVKINRNPRTELIVPFANLAEDADEFLDGFAVMQDISFHEVELDPDLIRLSKLVEECRAIQTQTNQRPPAELQRRRNDLMDKIRKRYHEQIESLCPAAS